MRACGVLECSGERMEDHKFHWQCYGRDQLRKLRKGSNFELRTRTITTSSSLSTRVLTRSSSSEEACWQGGKLEKKNEENGSMEDRELNFTGGAESPIQSGLGTSSSRPAAGPGGFNLNFKEGVAQGEASMSWRPRSSLEGLITSASD